MIKYVYKENSTTSKDAQQRNQCIIKKPSLAFCVTVFTIGISFLAIDSYKIGKQ